VTGEAMAAERAPAAPIRAPMSKLEIAWTALAIVLGGVLLLLAWRRWVEFDLTEALGFVTGAACVWLGVKQNIWNWPIGIANNVFYIIVFLQARLFADMSLQVAFAVLGAYGWYAWLTRNERAERLKVTSTPAVAWIVCAVAVTIATAALWPFLASRNDAAPFLDALTTTLSLAAQYLMTRKYLECWCVWISVDVISIALYAFKALELTAVLYAVFLAMCVVGYRDWRATISSDSPESVRA
jgi:nicotinamide mononucleotide transporter